MTNRQATDITPLTPMKKFLTTDGRIPRSTYWKFFGVFYLTCALLGFADDTLTFPEWAKALVGLAIFPLLLVGIIVQIKRWHDLNKSGWWVLINLIPCLGALWTLIECGFIPGTRGPNQFGPDPLAQNPPIIAR